MDKIRRRILAAGAAAAATAALPRAFANRRAKRELASSTKEAPFVSSIQEAGSGFPLMLLPGGGLNATILLHRQPALQRHRGVQGTVAASQRTCATPRAASPPALSRSTPRGIPTPTTSSV